MEKNGTIFTSSYFFTNLYFLVQVRTLGTIPAQGLTPPKRVDVLNVHPGDLCKASFARKLYDVKVLAMSKTFLCRKVIISKCLKWVIAKRIFLITTDSLCL